MKDEAKQGKIVISTIHCPSSETFLLFDRVICMTDGETVYNGLTSEISRYFDLNFKAPMKKYTNPADFLINMAHIPEKYKKDLTLDQIISSHRHYKPKIKQEADQIVKHSKGLKLMLLHN